MFFVASYVVRTICNLVEELFMTSDTDGNGQLSRHEFLRSSLQGGLGHWLERTAAGLQQRLKGP